MNLKHLSNVGREIEAAIKDKVLLQKEIKYEVYQT